MSLDVYLTQKRDEPTEADKACALLRDNGFDGFAEEIACRHETGYIELYEANITHNLSQMASEAGIYECLWRPEEVGITKAQQLVEPLQAGLDRLLAKPQHFQQFNAANGWGVYEQFVPWIQQYLCACRDNPDADVHVSR